MTPTDHRTASGPDARTWIGLVVYVAITLVLMFWPGGGEAPLDSRCVVIRRSGSPAPGASVGG